MGGAQRRNRCPIKITHSVLRQLFLSSNRRLLLQGEQPIKGPHLSYENSTVSVAVRGEGRKSNIRFASTCVPPASTGSNEALLRPKYALPAEPQIKSIEAWCGSLPGGMLAKSGGTVHRRSLFVLRKDNRLYRHDFDNGRLLDKVRKKPF